MYYFENSICANGDPQDHVYDIDSKATESVSKKNLHLALQQRIYKTTLTWVPVSKK